MVEGIHGASGPDDPEGPGFTSSDSEAAHLLGDDPTEAGPAAASDVSDRPAEVAVFIREIAERPGINPEDSKVIRAYLESRSDDFLRGLYEQLSRLRSDQIDLPTEEYIDRFTPHSSAFKNETYLHGTAHQMRVLILIKLIAEMTGAELSDIELKALGLAAGFHDTQRSRDYDDPDHGVQAAEYTKANTSLLKDDGDAKRLGEWIMKLHLMDDSFFEGLKDKRFKTLMKIFMDADAWERYRDRQEHPEGPNMKYVRYPIIEGRISHIADALANISGDLAPEMGDWKSKQVHAVKTAILALGLMKESTPEEQSAN